MYAVIVRSWLLIYHLKIRTSKSVEAVVISIGNLTIGGTGKTPMVSWMTDFCLSEGLDPAILTRGYGAKRKSSVQILNSETYRSSNSVNLGDEPLMLFHNHPQITLYISANRVKAAEQASKTAGLLILDDGMQHLKLHRDLNIVLFDASAGIGNGHLIPLGPLREPLGSLNRTDILIFTKTNLVDSKELKVKLQPFVKNTAPRFDSEYKPTGLIASKDQSILEPDYVIGKRCLLFSGIGNPSSFENTILKMGGVIAGHYVLPDHFGYGSDSLVEIKNLAADHSHDMLICTEKDWIKLESRNGELPPFYYLKMKMVIEPEFSSFLLKWFKERGLVS